MSESEENRFRNVSIHLRVNELEKAGNKEHMKRIGEKDMGKFL